MKYILDFDRVIFDVDSYYLEVEKRGLQSLTAHPSVWDTLDASLFVYPDARTFLETHNSTDIRILTAMRPELGPAAREYQKRKVAESGIQAFVNDVVFMEGLKGPYLKQMFEVSPTVFVDDKMEQILSAREHCPGIMVVQLLRASVSPQGEEDVDLVVQRIKSFTELDTVLNLV